MQIEKPEIIITPGRLYSIYSPIAFYLLFQKIEMMIPHYTTDYLVNTSKIFILFVEELVIQIGT